MEGVTPEERSEDESPWLMVDACPVCIGAKVEECSICGGSGQWERCDVPDRRELYRWSEVVYYCANAIGANVWPQDGGLAEQSAWFVEIARHYARIQAHSREQKLEASRRRARK